MAASGGFREPLADHLHRGRLRHRRVGAAGGELVVKQEPVAQRRVGDPRLRDVLRGQLELRRARSVHEADARLVQVVDRPERRVLEHVEELPRLVVRSGEVDQLPAVVGHEQLGADDVRLTRHERLATGRRRSTPRCRSRRPGSPPARRRSAPPPRPTLQGWTSNPNGGDTPMAQIWTPSCLMWSMVGDAVSPKRGGGEEMRGNSREVGVFKVGGGGGGEGIT